MTIDNISNGESGESVRTKLNSTITKSNTIAEGATVNATDAALRDRATHTGAQAISTVTDLQTTLDGKAASVHTHPASAITDFDTAVAANSAVAANTAKVTNATHTGDVTGAAVLTIAAGAVTLANMADLATNTLVGRTTAGVGVPEALTAAQSRTVLNVADGATSNQTDSHLLARENHTGTQASTTITGLGTAATTDATDYATAAQGDLADTAVQPADIDTFVESDPTGITGADAVTNIVSLTQAEYDAIGTPDASTLYVVT